LKDVELLQSNFPRLYILIISVDVENDPDTKLPVENYSSSWPNRGEIEFKNYYAKYRPSLPFVLKDVSFKISGSEKA